MLKILILFCIYHIFFSPQNIYRVHLFCQDDGGDAQKVAAVRNALQGPGGQAQYRKEHVSAQNQRAQVVFKRICILILNTLINTFRLIFFALNLKRIDIEMHHEKRLQAENKSERLVIDRTQTKKNIFREFF